MRHLPRVRHAVLVRVQTIPLGIRIIYVDYRTVVQVILVKLHTVFIMVLRIVQQNLAGLVSHAVHDLRVNGIVLQDGTAVRAMIQGRTRELQNLCISHLRGIHIFKKLHIHTVLDKHQRNGVIVREGKTFGVFCRALGAGRNHIHTRIHTVQHTVFVGVDQVASQIQEVFTVAPCDRMVRVLGVKACDIIVIHHITPALSCRVASCHEGILSPVIYYIVGKIHNSLCLGISVVLVAPEAMVDSLRIPLLQAAHGMSSDAIGHDGPLNGQVAGIPGGAILVAAIGKGAVVDHDIFARLHIEGIILCRRLSMPEMDIPDNHILGSLQVKILPCQGNALPGRRLPGYSHVFNAFLICHRLIQPDGA